MKVMNMSARSKDIRNDTKVETCEARLDRDRTVINIAAIATSALARLLKI